MPAIVSILRITDLVSPVLVPTLCPSSPSFPMLLVLLGLFRSCWLQEVCIPSAGVLALPARPEGASL